MEKYDIKLFCHSNFTSYHIVQFPPHRQSSLPSATKQKKTGNPPFITAEELSAHENNLAEHLPQVYTEDERRLLELE